MQYNWISVVSSTRFMLSVTSHPQRWGTVRTFGQCLICSGLCIHDHCMILTWKSSILTHTKVKGHPTTGWGGPRGSGYVKAPNFLDVQHYEGCRSSAICTSCLYPRRNPWYSFSGAVSTPGHMVPSRGATEKIPSDTTGNRSRDRQTSSTVPYPLRYPRPLTHTNWTKFMYRLLRICLSDAQLWNDIVWSDHKISTFNSSSMVQCSHNSEQFVFKCSLENK